jgi:flagellar biosynthesis/type III secretory pathway protein FliH
MKYTVTINEKSKTITVNLNGYEGVSKCCATDTFNLQTGIELALERAKVAKANAEAKKNPTAKSGDVMELVKALEKALPKGQVVIVGNGNGLTAKHKEWLHSLTDCKGGGYTEDDLDKAYREGYEDGKSEGEDECDCCDCDNCDLCYTEDEYAKAYDEGYNEGYEDGHSDGYDEGCDDIDEEAIIDAVRKAIRQ